MHHHGANSQLGWGIVAVDNEANREPWMASSWTVCPVGDKRILGVGLASPPE